LPVTVFIYVSVVPFFYLLFLELPPPSKKLLSPFFELFPTNLVFSTKPSPSCGGCFLNFSDWEVDCQVSPPPFSSLGRPAGGCVLFFCGGGNVFSPQKLTTSVVALLCGTELFLYRPPPARLSRTSVGDPQTPTSASGHVFPFLTPLIVFFLQSQFILFSVLSLGRASSPNLFPIPLPPAARRGLFSSGQSSILGFSFSVVWSVSPRHRPRGLFRGSKVI